MVSGVGWTGKMKKKKNKEGDEYEKQRKDRRSCSKLLNVGKIIQRDTPLRDP